jgi:hypothetical protein
MWSPPPSLGGRVVSGEWISEEREEKEKEREKKKGGNINKWVPHLI